MKLWVIFNDEKIGECEVIGKYLPQWDAGEYDTEYRYQFEGNLSIFERPESKVFQDEQAALDALSLIKAKREEKELEEVLEELAKACDIVREYGKNKVHHHIDIDKIKASNKLLAALAKKES